jgi:serine/threonine protein kinase
MKLADFGCSKCDDTTVSFTTIGSVLWMAPEVIRGKQGGHGRKADIWSLGCVFLEMATAEKPWGDGAFDNQMQALMHIEGSDSTPPIPSNLPAAVADLIRQCVQRDPALRPKASELLMHELVLSLPKAAPSVT